MECVIATVLVLLCVGVVCLWGLVVYAERKGKGGDKKLLPPMPPPKER